jgi:hypothetical protein
VIFDDLPPVLQWVAGYLVTILVLGFSLSVSGLLFDWLA